MLKSLVERLSNSEISVEEAARELDTAIREDHRVANAALAMLKVARGGRKISEVTYSRLYAVAQRSIESRRLLDRGDSSGDGSEEPDETVIAGARGRGAPGSAAGEEATVFAPGGSERGGAAGSSGNEEATVLASAAQRPGSSAPPGHDSGDGGDVDMPLDDAPGEGAAADTAAGGTRAPDVPVEATDESADEDEEEEAPTVIARLARSRLASQAREQAAPESEATDDAPADHGGSAPGDESAAGGGPAAAGDEAEDDDDEAPTVIARIARQRFASAAAERDKQTAARADAAAEREQEGTGRRDSTPGGERSPMAERAREVARSSLPEASRDTRADGGGEKPAAGDQPASRGTAEQSSAGRADASSRPPASGAGEQPPAPPAEPAAADDDDEDDDEEAPTVIARIARQRYSTAARELGREEEPEPRPAGRRRGGKGERHGPPPREQGRAPDQASAGSDDASADDSPVDPTLQDPEATIVASGSSGDGPVDPTIQDPEATLVATGTAPPTESATAPSTGSEPGTDRSSSGSVTPTSQRSWTPPGGETTPELKGLGPGSVIKDRFVLEKVLGSGGMGKVYQARDMLKVEAHDRNPYVALKVLTEDFKEHPEAFIALQRESSRQQRLAHPNIATVYDFDRIGRSGTQVFITMELMEGSPLNTFIKKEVRPKGGLPAEEAIPMVAQLGAALAYAHKRDIVHSDFKPGNAFLCNDGTIKVLDFGIARAVHAPAAAGEGDDDDATAGQEQTYFDPGQLGALTPAYASLEMLEGEPPDPRDDIYALACVAYELLTGQHPFGRKSAAKAKEAGMVPAPVKSLKRRQMKGLLRGLAFEREHRSPDVETFVEQLEGRLNWHKNPYVIGGALAVAVAIASTGPVLDWLEQRRIQQMVAQVQTGEREQIEEILGRFDELESAARATITDEARDTLQGYFEDRVRDAVDPDDDEYDFDRAENALARGEEVYPDSTSMDELAEYIESARDQRLNELNQQFMAALEEDRLLPDQGSDTEPNVPDILSSIREINADHGLLEDPRIPNSYAEVAQGAINTGDLERAADYLDTAESLVPDDIDLQNTQARLEQARDNRERRARVEELRERFDDELANMDDLDAFGASDEAIVELARLAPADSALKALRDAARPIAQERVEDLADAEEANTFVDDYQAVLEALGLHEVLVAARTTDDGDTPADIAAAAEERLDEVIADPSFDRDWEATVRNQLGYLDAALSGDEGEERLEQARRSVAEVYRERGSELAEDDRFSEALALLERGDNLDLEQAALGEALAEVEEAQNEFLREREQEAQQARIEGLKETMMIQAQALDLDAATETFREIEPQLEEDDPFLTVAAPDALGEAFETVAEERADEGDYRAALETAERGLDYAPNDRNLDSDRERYTVEVNTRELQRIFEEERSFDTARASRMIDEIRTWAPARYNNLESEFVNVLSERIRNLADESRAEAERLAIRASSVLPASSQLATLREQLAPRPWPEASAARAAIAAGRLNEAEAIIERGAEEQPEHPEVLNLEEELQGRKEEAQAAFEAFNEDVEAEEFADARRHLADARSLWVDNGDYRDAQSSLSEEIARARRQQSRVLQRSQDIEGLREAAETSGRDIVEEDWEPVPSPRGCTTRLAGNGERARAICFDLIHDQVRGPLMVVAPDGPENPTGDEFAITKYEVSNEDYNKYCFLSGNCSVDDDVNENLPRVGLSLSEMQEYAEWLSDRTGKSYRLPTEEEWVYAAEADGEQPPRDFNCRVTLGGTVLKGGDLVSVSVGQQNGWGLKNYIGNAQELVLAGGDEPRARGGAYSDSHSSCSLDIARDHNGEADNVTSFRLLLEDVEEAE